eukprot:CAMPEP_0117678018 /NCGR_PEP_ID=MMETSP0804-20121206/17053_1 /TAXON_ID=1074897 /ORGANISM="Tetraselmis astigmatica, Strain CCMP880" /LENGTH=66 /DNA_ID=CAMNT_0005487337 /DNA_START=883 /DNA_END=1083 /DNA_ORIENTATION=+
MQQPTVPVGGRLTRHPLSSYPGGHAVGGVDNTAPEVSQHAVDILLGAAGLGHAAGQDDLVKGTFLL